MLTIVCAIVIAWLVIAAIPSVLAGVLWGFFAIFSKIGNDLPAPELCALLAEQGYHTLEWQTSPEGHVHPDRLLPGARRDRPGLLRVLRRGLPQRELLTRRAVPLPPSPSGLQLPLKFATRFST